MKHSPAIDRALARAKAVGAEADPSVLEAWAEDQSCAYALKLYRLEQTLKRRADAFLERERHNDLYRYYTQKRDRSNACYYRPSQLQDSTATLVQFLLTAARDLADFESMPISPHVGRTSKRWQRTERFFRLMDAEREIRRQGGEVRHAARPARHLRTRLITEPWEAAPCPATVQLTFI